jgi:hypothetical protein
LAKTKKSVPAKHRDILDALKRSNLDPSRRVALQFVARIRAFTIVGVTSSGTIPHSLEHYLINAVCVNCDEPAERTFCSELCQQEATAVRYLRRILADSRIDKPDVQEALGVRLLMLAGGGYPTEQRHLSPGVRAKILERDSHICQVCGRPATQVDHIRGNSSEPSNLQSLCGPCNMTKAMAEAREVTTESNPEAFARIEAQFDRLAERIASEPHQRLCDDEAVWHRSMYSIRSARKKSRFPQ